MQVFGGLVPHGGATTALVMTTRSGPIWACLLGLSLAPAASGQQVRYYEQDGVTYRETRQVVQQPVIPATAVSTAPPSAAAPGGVTAIPQSTTTIVPAPRGPVARWFQRWRGPKPGSISPPLQPGETYRSIMVPVVEYRMEPKIKGRWNPFAKPRVEQKLVKHQRWENHIQRFPAGATPSALTATQLVQGISSPPALAQEVVTRVAVATRDGNGRPVPVAPGRGRTAALPHETEQLRPTQVVALRPIYPAPLARPIPIDHSIQQATAIQPARLDDGWRPSTEPDRP
jgi:hypothetical protein